MTPITCAKPSLPRGRSPSSPTTPPARGNIRSTNTSTPSATWWNVASQSSNSSDASRHASKRPPQTISPSSLSQPSSYGCDNCPHHLELLRINAIRTEQFAKVDPNGSSNLNKRELNRLAALDRYERYALTKRRRASRALQSGG